MRPEAREAASRLVDHVLKCQEEFTRHEFAPISDAILKEYRDVRDLGRQILTDSIAESLGPRPFPWVEFISAITIIMIAIIAVGSLAIYLVPRLFR